MHDPDLFAAGAPAASPEEGAAWDGPPGEAREGRDDGYVTLRVDEAACPAALLEDLRGIVAFTWMAEALRESFEVANYRARVYGPLGTFDGVLAERMPAYWRAKEGERPGGTQLWVPDGRHPLGRWLADVGARLLPLPPLDVLDAVLRRHGIEGSREPLPVMLECDGGFAVRVHKPNAKALAKVPGVAVDEALRSLWADIGRVPRA